MRKKILDITKGGSNVHKFTRELLHSSQHTYIDDWFVQEEQVENHLRKGVDFILIDREVVQSLYDKLYSKSTGINDERLAKYLTLKGNAKIVLIDELEGYFKDKSDEYNLLVKKLIYRSVWLNSPKAADNLLDIVNQTNI